MVPIFNRDKTIPMIAFQGVINKKKTVHMFSSFVIDGFNHSIYDPFMALENVRMIRPDKTVFSRDLNFIDKKLQ